MKPFKLIFIFFLAQVSACSYFFPDKEKDYVYSKEIKPLDIPPDLQAEESLPELDPALMPVTLSNTITHIDDGTETYLRINSPFAHAWRVVGKALTASSIEITDKNRASAIYYVQYDPDAQIDENGSFWDKSFFSFGGGTNQGRPYQVFLTQTERGTNIFVRDDFGDTLNHGDGLKLLNGLYETIEKDFVFSKENAPLDVQSDLPVENAPLDIQSGLPVENAPLDIQSGLPVENTPLDAQSDLPVENAPLDIQSDLPVENVPIDVQSDLPAEESLPEQGTVLMPVALGNTVTFIDEEIDKYLRVNLTFSHAWRVVGRTLTASSIEITDKNRSNATYYVQYDPDVQVVKDGSFWNEVIFFFGDDANQELPYQVFLTETEQGTNIFVRDDFGDNLNHGDGLKLLNLLYETIEKDFAR